MSADQSSPPVWFRLPPGFHDVSPNDREALDDVARALGSPGAQQQLSELMDLLKGLAGHHVVHTALGMHPEEAGSVCTSLFSLAVRTAEHANVRVGVARTALVVAESHLWDHAVRRLVELPSALPCYLIAGTITLPGTDQHLFQARVITPHADGQHILVLDLTSAAIQHAGAYTAIIEAITHTVSFTDPNPSPADVPRTSRILEVLL
ncbi:hypothetical protein ABT237_09605 [Streptomyces sp. NPDC001581]|uniref:hypothetical protein n=1 Tax=Streptomyces sp. NPDC001581 TaxID=3154386 RepID=UPI003327CC2E